MKAALKPNMKLPVLAVTAIEGMKAYGQKQAMPLMTECGKGRLSFSS